MIKIDKGIPMPPRTPQSSTPIYPYREMEIGDSFHVDGPERVNKIRTQASTVWSRRTGFKFSVRVEPGGCRVWRVE